MSIHTALSISGDDRRDINAFARRVKGLPLFSHCQVAIRCLDGQEHANLAYFGITEPGTVGATDLADFGPRLADLKHIEGHASGYVVADFYTYGRERVGGDLQLDTNVQAVWFNGVLVALSEGRANVEWLVDASFFREPELVSNHAWFGTSYSLYRTAGFRVHITWADGTDSWIGDWDTRLQAREEARRWIEDNAACHTPPTAVETCGHFDVRRPTDTDPVYRCSDCGEALSQACDAQDRLVTRSAATGVRHYHRGAPCACGHTVEQHLSAASRCDVQDAVCGCMRFRLDDDR